MLQLDKALHLLQGDYKSLSLYGRPLILPKNELHKKWWFESVIANEKRVNINVCIIKDDQSVRVIPISKIQITL